MSPTNDPGPVRRRRGGRGRHTYAMRRLVLMCAVIAVLAAAFGLVNLLFGGDADPDATITAPSTAPSTTAAATTTTVAKTTTTVKEVTVPSQEHPLSLLIMGDSDAGNYGPALKRLVDPTGVVVTTIDYHIASGLARPDYFDWPARMQQVMPLAHPQIVVVTFGGNDAQGLRNLDGTWVVSHNPGQGLDDTTWRAEYGRRVSDTMDFLTQDGRTLIWVGITNDDEAVNTARLKVQDEVVRDEVAKHPGVLFVDTWAMFSGVDGGWAASIVDPRDGVGKDVRRADGFHLNETGAEILAWKIDQLVVADLRARGANV